MDRRLFIFCWLMLTIFIGCFTSCEQSPCSDSDGVQLNAGFYFSDGTTVSDTAMKNLEPFLIDNNDTLYLENMVSSDYKMVFLPLSKTSDSSFFVLKFDTLNIDTISIFHTKTLKLESHECGFDFFYEISGAETTTHAIDSIWIRKKNVEYGEQENLKIFF